MNSTFAKNYFIPEIKNYNAYQHIFKSITKLAIGKKKWWNKKEGNKALVDIKKEFQLPIF